jgi:3-hydroxyisobutyrate dehydrogenase
MVVRESKIGVIGMGIMGAPMARNLLRAGYAVSVFNRTRAKAEGLVAEGAVWRDSPAALADAAEVVISVVSDSPDVEEVYLGRDGVCTTIRGGSLTIDMSTVAPDVARVVAAEAAKRGASFLDAPISGGKTAAEDGTLSIMVGGEGREVDRARPIFEVLGKSTVHCGPVGSGQLTKLCNQILCGLNLLATGEALVFARRVGLDPQTVLEAVSQGAAGSWALKNLGSRMIARDFAPMFMVDLQQKDLRIALAAAREAGIPLPGTALVSQLLAANQAAHEGREGTQALIKTLERLAGMA